MKPRDSISIADLRSEFASEIIGPLILREVALSCARIARAKYAPEVYANAPTWRDSDVEDLAFEVIEVQLLRKGQLAYIFDVAGEDIRRWRIELAKKIRRQLASRAMRTVAANLSKRAVGIMERGDYDLASGRPKRWKPAGTEREMRDPTDSEVRSAAIAASVVPRMADRGVERAARVYNDDKLAEVVALAAATLPTWLGRREIERVLEEIVAPWSLGRLVPYEPAEYAQAVGEVGSKEEAETAVEEIRGRVGAAGVQLLARKAAGEAEVEAIRALGFSYRRGKALLRRAEDVALEVLRDLDESTRDAALHLLARETS